MNRCAIERARLGAKDAVWVVFWKSEFEVRFSGTGAGWVLWNHQIAD